MIINVRQWNLPPGRKVNEVRHINMDQIREVCGSGSFPECSVIVMSNDEQIITKIKKTKLIDFINSHQGQSVLDYNELTQENHMSDEV